MVNLKANFYVTDRKDPILGIDACSHLNLLRIVDENICEVAESPSSPRTADAMRRSIRLSMGTSTVIEKHV